MNPIDEHVQIVAKAFREKLAKLHEKSDWPSYRESEIRLIVTGSREDAKFKLVWYNPLGEDVKASSLDSLMQEVNHRLNFQDFEAAKIESSMRALAPPDLAPESSLREELDVEIPF